MPKATIKEAIISVLKKEARPLSIKSIYEKIIEYDYYRFRALNPLNIVTSEIRRHSKGADIASGRPKKFYQLLSDGTYWLINSPIPDEYYSDKRKVTKKEIVRLKFSFAEELKNKHKEYVHQFKNSIVELLKEIDPKTFEFFSKRLLEVYGFKDVSVTRYSKDGGIDGYGKLKVGIAHLSVAFQCKRWKNNVISKKEIQSFRGDIQGKFEQGIFFTNSTYSKDAKEVSIQKGAVPIILIDGISIVEIMMDKQFGIEIENLPLYINALDRALTE